MSGDNRNASSSQANGTFTNLPGFMPLANQQIQAQPPQGQWPFLPALNGGFPALQQPAQLQQLFGQQLQASAIAPQVQAMLSAMNLPLLSQQLLGNAMAPPAPITKADEAILIDALSGAQARGETYKDALNGLHGVSYCHPPPFAPNCHFEEKWPSRTSLEGLLLGTQAQD